MKMAAKNYDVLKIENQMCFPLYACSREVIKQYKPFLDEMDLTYTQYITMLALWENKEMTVKELGDILYLDSGTLTPLLKKLEHKGYVTRTRSRKDERNLIISVTEQGESIKDKAVEITEEINRYTEMTREEAGALYRTLYKILGRLGESREA